MPLRRKVPNLLALAILGVVVDRPMHPYEMATTLRARAKDQDMQIKWGSLYTVVQNMQKHGLLEATGSTRQGARPERTIYRITETGRQELQDWVRELVSTPQTEHPRFVAGLSMLAALPPGEAARLLEERLVLLDEQIARRRQSLSQHLAEVPRLFLVEAEYELALHEAEAAWVRSLLEEFAAGSFPGLDQWAAASAQRTHQPDTVSTPEEVHP